MAAGGDPDRARARRAFAGVEEVLSYSRPYGVALALERAISFARKEAEAEVDRLVRESGLSRSEFASQIGTSASRLSTYATGRVTPSAALMLRLQRTNKARRAI